MRLRGNIDKWFQDEIKIVEENCLVNGNNNEFFKILKYENVFIFLRFYVL